MLAAAVKAAAAAPAPRLRGSSVAVAAAEDEAEAEETEEDDATVGAWTAARGLGCAGGCGTSEWPEDAASAGTIAPIRCNVPAGCEGEA